MLPPMLADLYARGPDAVFWAAQSRHCVEVDLAGSRFYWPSHALVSDDLISFETKGTLPPTVPDLPDGLDKWAMYYPLIVNPNVFQVSTTINGPPIALGPGEGVGELECLINYERMLKRAIELATARVLACLNQSDWVEPPGGWGDDIIELILNLVVYPKLHDRGYKAPPEDKDGYRLLWQEATKRLAELCAGKNPPLGVDPLPPGQGPGGLATSWDLGQFGPAGGKI